MSKDKGFSEKDTINSEAKPIFSHLVELRARLLWVIVIMIIGTALSFIFVDNIYSFLVQPLADAMNENDIESFVMP